MITTPDRSFSMPLVDPRAPRCNTHIAVSLERIVKGDSFPRSEPDTGNISRWPGQRIRDVSAAFAGAFSVVEQRRLRPDAVSGRREFHRQATLHQHRQLSSRYERIRFRAAQIAA